jgi:hypothetical protein
MSCEIIWEGIMKKIKYFKLRYNSKNVLLAYCNYKNFKWSLDTIDGTLFICINENYSRSIKSNILHKIIKGKSKALERHI